MEVGFSVNEQYVYDIFNEIYNTSLKINTDLYIEYERIIGIKN